MRRFLLGRKRMLEMNFEQARMLAELALRQCRELEQFASLVAKVEAKDLRNKLKIHIGGCVYDLSELAKLLDAEFPHTDPRA